jgi:sigma-E factor negative regulatory protein RseC
MEDRSRTNTINHNGIVHKSDNESVTVIITSESACSGCHAEGSCSLFGKEEKIVEVKGNYDVKEGDIVTVIMKQSTGFIALFFGYLLPLVIVIITLTSLLALNYTELISGLLSIASLLPYYLVLYFFRKKMNNKFVFSLKA